MATLRYRSLDHWRGVAALSIVIFHSTLFISTPELQSQLFEQGVTISNGLDWLACLTGRLWGAVPMFFVISGYCITASAIKAEQSWRGVGRYFLRRIMRIYPPYWVAVLLTAAAAVVGRELVGDWLFETHLHPIPHPCSLNAIQWFGNLTLTESWRSLVVPGELRFQLWVAWTLVYEEQFYFVIGVMLLLPRRFLFPMIAVVTLITLLNSVPLNIRPVRDLGLNLNSYQLRMHGTFLKWMWLDFAVGCAVCYWIHFASRTQKWLIALAACVGLLMVCRDWDGLATFRASQPQFRITAILYGIVLVLLWKWDGQVASMKMLKPIAWLGRRCYSIYLVHYPITIAISSAAFHNDSKSAWFTLLIVVPACVVVSLLAGGLFYRLVEQRFEPSSRVAIHEDGRVKSG